ncbi:MAG: PLP-dependent aminotransferase family protein [Alicyclobacillaceae bacterium]|nr:PLP-dependent aminotransferase family protein [Alicyclobacillaceae bacterium]
MELKIDRHDKTPIYRQIVRFFEEGILSGRFPPGSHLPPERRLAEQLGVNRSTVSTAYEELRSTGLVYSVQGSGTRVSEHSWGFAPSRIPNWHQYASQGVFQPTLPLVKRIWEAVRDPRNIDFARGQLSPDLLPAEDLNQLLQEISISLHGYPDPRGEESLRAAVREHLHNTYGIQVAPEQILITSGAQQALHLITQCLLNPGDAVGLEKPSYSYSLPLYASAGLRPFPIPTDKDGLLPDAIIDLHRRHKIRMIFVNPTYQNPTGSVLNFERRKSLLKLCGDLRIPIVEDDAYTALTLDGAPKPPPPLMAMSEGNHGVIYVGTLSKTVAPGLRIGWVVAPVPVINRLADAKEQMDFGISIITQQVAETYLKSGHWEKNVKRLRKALTLRRNAMINALKAYANDGIQWRVPNGSYHIWCQTEGKIEDSTLLESAISNGIVIAPGRIYGAEPGYFRLTYASCRLSDIQEGIERLTTIIRQLSVSTRTSSLSFNGSVTKSRMTSYP